VLKERLEHADVVVALEAVGIVVLTTEAFWLEVQTTDLEPGVLLAGFDLAVEQLALDRDACGAHRLVLSLPIMKCFHSGFLSLRVEKQDPVPVHGAPQAGLSALCEQT
jgi:hypothetical protein